MEHSPLDNTHTYFGAEARSSSPGSGHAHVQPGHHPPVKRSGSGLWFAVLAYLFLSFLSPLQIGIVAWRILILLVVPCITGLITGFRQGGDSAKIGRFRAGFHATSWPMALYTIINLIIVHIHVGSSPSPFETFLVAAGVTLVHTLIAALLSGLTAALCGYNMSGNNKKRGGHR